MLLRNSSLIVILLVNLIFVLKYGVRQEFLPLYLVLLLYVVLFVGGFVIIDRWKEKINRYAKFNSLFLAIILIVFVAFVIISYAIDGNQLGTDRWSALEVSVKSVLNFEYPYDKLDHMGGRSSNFPGLIYIATPFYLIGNIALLQPFTFLLVMLFIRNFQMKNHQKLLFLFLFLSSVAYLWEVFAKSDLMSNVILVLLFIVWWSKKNPTNYIRKPILLSFFAALLVLTRGFLAVPLTLFLFGPFLKVSMKEKIRFGLFLVVFLVALSLPILLNLPSEEILLGNNPVRNQTAYAPYWLMMVVIFIPFFISPMIKGILGILRWSYIIMSLLLLGLFINNLILEGVEVNIYGGLFDISYLGILIPFAIFFYIFDQTDKNTVSV